MEWISCEDRLPEPESYVLTATPYDFVADTMLHIEGFTLTNLLYCEDKIEGAYWFNDQIGEESHGVTHWMPLPEPPKESE